MKSVMRVGITLMFLMMLCAGISAQAQEMDRGFVEGELLVLLKPSTDPIHWIDQISSKSGLQGFDLIQRMSTGLNLWRMAYPVSSFSAEQALAFIGAQREVQIAQLNHTQLSLRGVPDDPSFPLQWALANTGTNGGSGTSDIQAVDAWDITTGGVTSKGDTIVVAVIDGGFNWLHEDLVQNIFVNRNEIAGNGIDDDGNGYIDDVTGWNAYTNAGVPSISNHGTHVAGIIGARGNNGVGVSGVNWRVKILPISGSSTLESTVVTAYAYALDIRRLYNETNGELGAYVVATNSSFGVDYGDPAEFPLWCAMYDSLGLAGVISAGATANLNVNVDVVNDVPTACGSNFLISVTNTTSTDVRNQGAAFGLNSIDLGAPGTSIHSTTISGYGNLTGTSMATPHVAGAIALMYSAICPDIFSAYANNPAGLALYVRNNLLTHGVDQVSTLQGLVATGGRLNLWKAVNSVTDTCIQVLFDAQFSVCDSCNGSIAAQVIGGSSPFTYVWSNGETTPTITGLCPGEYLLTVTDAQGDTIVGSEVISDIGGPVLDVSVVDVSCAGGADGEISISGADNYYWNDAVVGSNRGSLQAGVYLVYATLANENCTTAMYVEVIEPLPIQVEFEHVLPAPYTSSTGQIEASVSGGVAPYQLSWSTGAVNLILSGVPVGDYELTITDANGCEISFTHFLGYPLGSDFVSEERIAVYPNPTDGRLVVEGMPAQGYYKLYDMTGREVASGVLMQGVDMVEMGLLNKGMYQLQLTSGSRNEVFRIMLMK